MEKLKMIQVEKSVHKEAKEKAVKKGVSLKAYIKKLVSEDK